MRRLLTLLCFAALPAWAADPAMTVEGASIPETTPIARTAAGYLTVTNTGDDPVTLTAVEADISAAAELHESVEDGDVMRMEPREAVEIAPGEAISLAPGGLHVMFMGLNGPLSAGDEVAATLVFADGARLPVTFSVDARDGHSPADHDAHMNDPEHVHDPDHGEMEMDGKDDHAGH